MRKITDLFIDVLVMAMFVGMVAMSMWAMSDFSPIFAPPGAEAVVSGHLLAGSDGRVK